MDFMTARRLCCLLISFGVLAQTSLAIAANTVSVGNASGQSQIARGPTEALIDGSTIPLAIGVEGFEQIKTTVRSIAFE